MLHIKSFVQTVLLPLAFLFMLLHSQLSAAQNAPKIKYASLNNAGLLAGERGEALMLQTLHGLQKDRWFSGAGVGLDFYGYRTIPVFLDVRRDFSTGRNTPFVYADGGINFLWLNAAQKQQLPSASSSPGLYYDFGLGWKLSGKNIRSCMVSVGYSLKQVKYKFYPYNPAPTPELQSENFDRYNMLYRRVVVKIGFEL